MYHYIDLRLQIFPKGAGKGSDTILLCEFLDDLLSEPGGPTRVDSRSTALYMFVFQSQFNRSSIRSFIVVL